MHRIARLVVGTLLVWIFASPAIGQSTAFKRVQVTDGPTVEYPAHWTLADDATIQNRVHASQAIADAAGVDLSGFQRRNRVIIESLPRPNTAQIRASIVTPQQYSESDLRNASPEYLQSLKRGFEEISREQSATSTVKVQKVGAVRVEKIAGRYALVVPYTRTSEANPDVWQVEQIKIPFENKILALTLSYRLADLNTMKPILERVKHSVQF